MKKEIIISTIITIVSLAIAFAAGFFANQFINPPELELPILSQAQEIILENAYYDSPPAPALEYGMIHGMVGALGDPYAAFVEPPQHELNTNTFEGHFGGIGSQVTRSEDNQILLYPFPDGPAAEAGIHDGAVLLAVDGTPITSDIPLNDVVSMVRGEVGKKVFLTIKNPTDTTETEISVTREDFPIPSVVYRKLEQDPTVGLIDINIIAASTADEVKTGVQELQNDGVNSFILDLRGNTGGLLDAGIDIARLFLEDGEIISLQYKGDKPVVHQVRQTGELKDIPLVVLIDHNTASASEIISGALQVNQRAPLIGTSSFGKNTIQLVFTLEDSSSIHVTHGVWWLPGNEPGGPFVLSPDIPIDEADQTDVSYFKAALDYFQTQP